MIINISNGARADILQLYKLSFGELLDWQEACLGGQDGKSK
jgi:hypothetical protein